MDAFITALCCFISFAPITILGMRAATRMGYKYGWLEGIGVGYDACANGMTRTQTAEMASVVTGTKHTHVPGEYPKKLN